MTQRVAELIGQGPFGINNGWWQGQTPNDEPVGSDHMTRLVVVALRSGLTAFNGSTAQAFVSHGSNVLTTGGWTVAAIAAGINRVRWGVARVGGVVIVDSSADLFVVSGTQVLVIGCTFDVANAVARNRVNGATSETTVSTAYNPPTERIQIGGRPTNNDNNFRDGAVCAFVGTDSVALTAQELVDLEEEARVRIANGRDFKGLLPNAVIYDARDAVGANFWPSQQGAVKGVRLSRQGNIGVMGVPGRVQPP